VKRKSETRILNYESRSSRALPRKLTVLKIFFAACGVAGILAVLAGILAGYFADR